MRLTGIRNATFALLAAWALALGAPASAAVLHTGNNGVLQPGSYSFYDWTWNTGGTAEINDTYRFNVATSSQGKLAFNLLDIDLFGLTISGGDVTVKFNGTDLLQTTGGSYLLDLGQLDPLLSGTYRIRITGDALGLGAKYFGELQLAAVPLPPAALLFGSVIFGLAVVARRRGVGQVQEA